MYTPETLYKDSLREAISLIEDKKDVLVDLDTHLRIDRVDEGKYLLILEHNCKKSCNEENCYKELLEGFERFVEISEEYDVLKFLETFVGSDNESINQILPLFASNFKKIKAKSVTLINPNRVREEYEIDIYDNAMAKTLMESASNYFNCFNMFRDPTKCLLVSLPIDVKITIE